MPSHFAIRPLAVARAHVSFNAAPRLKPNLQRLREIKTANPTQPGRPDRHQRVRARFGIKGKCPLRVSFPAIVRAMQPSSVSKRARLKRGPVEHHPDLGRAEGHFDPHRRTAIGQQHDAADGMGLARAHQLKITDAFNAIGQLDFGFDGFITVRRDAQVWNLFLLDHCLVRTRCCKSCRACPRLVSGQRGPRAASVQS